MAASIWKTSLRWWRPAPRSLWPVRQFLARPIRKQQFVECVRPRCNGYKDLRFWIFRFDRSPAKFCEVQIVGNQQSVISSQQLEDVLEVLAICVLAYLLV